MKYILILFACSLLSISTLQAQEIAKNAVGLRLTEADGFWAEVTYQYGLDTDTRLEFDLGFRSVNGFQAIKLTGIYQWVFNIDQGLNWYVGPGIGGGIADFDGVDNSDFFAFVAGDVGIEYNFEFPLLISFDFRPEIYLDRIRNANTIIFNFGLSARYQF